jgi:S-methylmethionine-dependent homocysteine/selenocysteine methylase
MADQITINLVAVNNILRKLKTLEEEARIILSETDKTISNAELEGWNDSKYHVFKDTFYDTKALIIGGLKRIDEEHIPYLKKIIRSTEDFN